MSPTAEQDLENAVDITAAPSGATSITQLDLHDDVHDGQAINDHQMTSVDPTNLAEIALEETDKFLKLTDQTNLLPLSQIISVFLGLAICIVVSTLDSTLVATALPSISTAFRAGSVVSFVPSAYLLTSTAFQPLYGRFSDIFGRKGALSLAMIVFIIGNLAAGFSTSIQQLIIFRGIAGAGGGGIISMAQIVMSDIVSLRDRGKYQGIIGVVVAVGNAIGPLIGGLLSAKVTWRWCFWVTLPLSLCAIVVVNYLLPLKSVQGDIKRKLLAVDYIGTGLTLVGCTLVILPLIWGGVTFPWSSSPVLATLITGIFVVSLFCFWEWKGARLPIVPMYIFKHVTVSGVYVAMFVNGFVFYSSLYYIPQFFQVALSYSPIHAATILLPFLVTQTVASFISGVMVSRTGRYRTIIYLGFTIWSIGSGCLSTVNSNTSIAADVIFMLLSGCGAGQTLQTTTVAAQASVSRQDMSVVTAVRNFVRLLGGTLSLAIGGTIINNSLRAKMTSLGLPSSTVSQIIDDPSLLGPLVTSNSSSSTLNISSETAQQVLSGYTAGFRIVFILNAVLAAFAVLSSFFMIRHKELMRGDEEQLREEAKLALKSRGSGGLPFRKHHDHASDEKHDDQMHASEAAYSDGTDKVERHRDESDNLDAKNRENLGDTIELQALHTPQNCSSP